MSENKKLTSASGIPYYYNEDSLSAGPRGPLLLQDFKKERAVTTDAGVRKWVVA